MGTPKSSMLIGFSIINHPFWGTAIVGNAHMDIFAGEISSAHLKKKHPDLGSQFRRKKEGVKGVEKQFILRSFFMGGVELG